MTDGLNRMASLCRQRCETVMAAYAYGDMNLDTFVTLQAQKVKNNMQNGSMRDSADFVDSAVSVAEKLLGKEEAAKLRESLKMKVICTADHHGSLYCSQFLQGDLLFALILEKLGERDLYVPVMAAGQVELENSTYSRGICAYSSRENKLFLPIFPAKYSVQLASHALPVTRDMTDRFRKRFVDSGEDSVIRQTLSEICRDIYDARDVLDSQSFSDQTTVIGHKLMSHVFSGGTPSFAYLEMETVIRSLLLEELSDESSLLFKLLYVKKVREMAVQKRNPEGLSLGDFLFRAADEKGRKVMLSLTADGFLTGKDWRKEPVSFSTDPKVLTGLIRERKVFPGVFTEALLIFFERGITWMGGMFQASYMPRWQSELVCVLEETGYDTEARLIRGYDCSGYVCGPMLLLYGGEGFATTAGPVELWRKPVSFDSVRRLAKQTSLWDGHMIGLSEMYFDLVLRDERENDWYKTIAEELFRNYPENIVTDGRK